MSLPRLIVVQGHCRLLIVGNINSDATGFDTNCTETALPCLDGSTSALKNLTVALEFQSQTQSLHRAQKYTLASHHKPYLG